MTKPPDFFTKEAAVVYDERNRKLSRISDCMHFVTELLLRELPAKARILCVGTGTGAEILALAAAHPEWTFVGVDPSQSMLDVCATRLKEAGISGRCELVHGYIEDLPKPAAPFDAALSILVAHFIKREERQKYFNHLTSQLRDGGYLINAEISHDLNAPSFPYMLKGWEQVHTLMGATPESLATLPQTLREVLTVLAPEVTEDLIRQSGIKTPVRFFQALMICGWFGVK